MHLYKGAFLAIPLSASSVLAFAPPQNRYVQPSATATSTSSSSSTFQSPSFLAINNIIQGNSQLSVATSDILASEITPQSVTCPNGNPNPWEIHKFGGASLADADLYRTVGDLLITESSGRLMPRSENGDDEQQQQQQHSGPIPTMAVVSARGGMTDQLVAVVDSALQDMKSAESDLTKALEGQLSILKELAPSSITDEIEERMRKDAQDILSVVQSLRMIRSVPPSVMEW